MESAGGDVEYDIEPETSNVARLQLVRLGREHLGEHLGMTAHRASEASGLATARVGPAQITRLRAWAAVEGAEFRMPLAGHSGSAAQGQTTGHDAERGLALLLTTADTAASRVRAGQAWARLVLEASDEGIPVEVLARSGTDPRMRGYLDAAGLYDHLQPRLLLRVGG